MELIELISAYLKLLAFTQLTDFFICIEYCSLYNGWNVADCGKILFGPNEWERSHVVQGFLATFAHLHGCISPSQASKHWGG